MTICLISPQEFLTAQNALAPHRETGAIIRLERNDVNAKSIYNIAARFQDYHDAYIEDVQEPDIECHDIFDSVHNSVYCTVDKILCAAMDIETSGDAPLRKAFNEATYASLDADKIDIICKALYSDTGIRIGVLHTDEIDRKSGSFTWLKAITDQVVTAKRLSDMRDHSDDGSAMMYYNAHTGYQRSYDILWHTMTANNIPKRPIPEGDHQHTARILKFSRQICVSLS